MNSAEQGDGGKEKVVIDKDLQIEMMKFFLATSVPRILKGKEVKSHS